MIRRVAIALALSAAVTAPAFADEYGRHPAYLHALTDLRTAAWQVDHRRPEDGRVANDEAIVHDELVAAIRDFERAARQDGKNVDWQPPPDVQLAPEGRLHAAIDLMRRARADIARAEDDPRSRTFQQHGLSHVDAALDAARHAVGDARDRGRRE